MRRLRFVTWTSSLLLSGCLSSPPGRSDPWTVRSAPGLPPTPRQPWMPNGTRPAPATPQPAVKPVTPKTFETPIMPKTDGTNTPRLAPTDKLVPEPIDPINRPPSDANRIDVEVNKPVRPSDTTTDPPLRNSPFQLQPETPSDPPKSDSSDSESSESPRLRPFRLDIARDAASPEVSTARKPTGRVEELPPPISNTAARDEAPLMLEVTNPKRRPLGTLASFDVLVTNASERTMENVVVDVDFDDELAFPGRAGKTFRKSLGILRPGQSRDLRLSLRGDRIGKPACRFEVSADDIPPIRHEAFVEFGEPKLMMKLIGPPRRTVGGQAEFTVRIANISSQPLDDVQVTLRHDGAFTPREATNGFLLDKTDRDKHQIRWSLGRLAPGAGVQVQADFDCKQLAEHACVSAQVKCHEKLVEEADRCVTVVAPPGDLDVHISDQAEPTRVGSDVAFVVRVTNRGLQEMSDLQLELLHSEHLQVRRVDGKLKDQAVTLREETSSGARRLILPNALPPDETLHLSIHAAAMSPGDAELRIIVKPASGEPPVESSEFTVINP